MFGIVQVAKNLQATRLAYPLYVTHGWTDN